MLGVQDYKIGEESLDPVPQKLTAAEKRRRANGTYKGLMLTFGHLWPFSRLDYRGSRIDFSPPLERWTSPVLRRG